MAIYRGSGTPTGGSDVYSQADLDAAVAAAAASEAAAAASEAAALAAQTAAELAETNAATSETNAAASASAASTSESNAATSASNASTSETNAAASEAAAAASYDSFDDRYLGAKASDPTLDNDGDALLTGALYWNTVSDELRWYDGAAWNAVATLPATSGNADKFLQVNSGGTNEQWYDLFGSVNTFTANQWMSKTTPILYMTDGATANKTWGVQNFAGGFYLTHFLDNGTFQANMLQVTTTAKQLKLDGTSLTYDSSEVAREGRVNNFTFQQKISTTFPLLTLYETDTTDENYGMYVTGGQYHIGKLSDAGTITSAKMIVDQDASQLLLKADEISFDGGQLQPTSGVITINAAHTLVRDNYRYILYHSSGSHTWTIPPASSVDFPVGTKIQITNAVGTVTLARGTGVALSSIGNGGFIGDANKTIASGNNVELLKWAANQWFVLHHGGVT